MTVDDVLDLFPSEARRTAGARATEQGTSTLVAIEHARIAGAHAGTVAFQFGSDGRLIGIRMTPDVRPGNAAGAFRELDAALAGELGTPTDRSVRTSAGTRTDVSSWTSANTRIQLRLTEPLPEKAFVLLLDMRSGEIRAVPQSVEVLYEPYY